MRILTFTSLFPNAIDPTFGIFVQQRVAHLAKQADVDSQIVAPIPFFPRWLKSKRWGNVAGIPEREEIAGLAVYHPRYFMIPKIFMRLQGLSLFLCCLPLAKQLHRRWKFDCVDAHYIYPDGFAAVLIAKWFGVPVVLTGRGTDINLLPTFRLVRGMIKWSLSRANAVVAVSDALKKAMIELGVDEGKIHVVPNGVDSTRFQPVPASEARSKVGMPANGRVIVSVGTLIPSKGHELVIRALSRLVGRGGELQLYIIGEGWHRRFLENLVAELRLGGKVHLIGKRPNEELRYWFSGASVSCLASAREGWPNVVTESLACGTPVVATRVGGIPEILHSEDLGVLVDQNVDSLARGLEYALGKTWNREGIAQRTKGRTWEDVASELEKLFKTQIMSRVCTP